MTTQFVDCDTFDRLDPKAIKRVGGPAWESIRPSFVAVHASVIEASPTAHGHMMTSYVKYLTDETGSQPIAVVWLSKSSELLIGLALPADTACPAAMEPMGMTYKGITVYLRVRATDPVPDGLVQLAVAAYQHVQRCGSPSE
jgi:hypothetical protein